MRLTKGTTKAPCPFCDSASTTMSHQGVPVCNNHQSKGLELRCPCGDWLEVRQGKYGPYLNCFKCGNLSMSKALEFNKNLPNDFGKKKQVQWQRPKHYKAISEKKGETVISSDELDFL